MRKVVFSVLGILTCGLFVFSLHSMAENMALVAKPPAMKMGDPLPANLFVELAKAINPAVVNISTSVIPRQMTRDPFWDQLEQMYGVRGPQRREGGKPMPYSLGTGFVIREDGLIITNAHVIRNADLVTVSFTEGSDQSFEAKVIGFDERADIALLKIQPKGKIAVAALGSSADVEVGEWVAAFGNPFGHGHTVTKGIISASARTLEEINRFPLLQTDTAINPGNSGGPLVNSKGYVIGVNSAIDARGQGISFAIPIDEVKKILPELEKNGRLRKGYLGVGLDDGTSQTGEAISAVVTYVGPGSPADRAGLRYNDFVTDVNGKKISNAVEFSDLISGSKPGTKLVLTVERPTRGGLRKMKVNAVVGEEVLNSGR